MNAPLYRGVKGILIFFPLGCRPDLSSLDLVADPSTGEFHVRHFISLAARFRAYLHPCPSTQPQDSRVLHGLPASFRRFDIIKALKICGHEFGFTRRLIAHLELLVAYTNDADWHRGNPVAWPSVSHTAERLGISREQVRRNELRLVELEAIVHRDSSNHRRYGQRNESQGIVYAYGLDLRPLGILWSRLSVRAQQFLAECQERLSLCQTISSHRRRIAGLVQAGASLPVCTSPELGIKVARSTSLVALRTLAQALADLIDRLCSAARAAMNPKRWHRRHQTVAHQ